MDCMHICFFVFNSVLALDGLALFSYGGYMLTDDTYFDSTTVTDISTGGAGIVVGLVAFLVVALGCYALIKKHKLLLYLYIFLLGLLSITLFALGLKAVQVRVVEFPSDIIIIQDAMDKKFGKLMLKDPTKIAAKMKSFLKYYECELDPTYCASNVREKIDYLLAAFMSFSIFFAVLGLIIAWYTCCITMDMDEFYD